MYRNLIAQSNLDRGSGVGKLLYVHAFGTGIQNLGLDIEKSVYRKERDTAMWEAIAA
jgi:hypothetical protein